MPPILSFQFVRYLLVGGMNTVFGYGAFAFFLFLGLDYKLASLLGLVLGIAFSFTTQGTLVFRNATPWTFARFVLAWIALYGLNIGVIALLTRSFALDTYLAGAIATVPVTLTSYFVLKLWVFRRAPETAPPEATELSRP